MRDRSDGWRGQVEGQGDGWREGDGWTGVMGGGDRSEGQE